MMTLLLLHGVAGGWDELLVALAAFGVMWLAVKLAGRKQVADDDDDEPAVTESAPDVEQTLEDPVHPSATPRV